MNQKGFSQIFVFVVLGIIIISAIGYFVFVKNQHRNLPIGNGDSYAGVLSVATDCMSPEGCGPKYKLYDSEFRSFIPLLGNIKEKDSELIVRVIGSKTTFPPSEYNDMNYRGSTEAIKVSSYSVLSKIPYLKFLVKKGGEYTLQKYPCLARKVQGRIGTAYRKTFSWEVVNNTPIIKVRMTDTVSGIKPEAFYELWYDGNSGDFIKEVTEPKDKVFCQ